MTLSRRWFLGGAAGLIALPFLPSLLPRGARAEDARPRRNLFMFAPNGVRMEHWRPTGFGAGYTLSRSLAQLADVRDELLVLSGVSALAGRDNLPGDHARGTGSFLTCRRVAFDHIANDVSADQVIAQQVGHLTPFRSLELGVEGGSSSGFCDSGYACAYTQNIAWSSETTPVPKLSDPRVIFDRLFAGADVGLSAAQRERRKVYRASVLDAVTEQAGDVSRRVAADDRHRLDQYLTGVRELERRIDDRVCAVDAGVPEDVLLETHADVLVDLLVSALQCDLTRVATLMLGNAGSNLIYSFLPGVTGAHHQLSHHQSAAANLDQLSSIDAWEVGRFGRLVRKLRDIPEGDGTLLDHCVVLFGSEISDGNAHNHDDMPLLLAGRGKGLVTPGRHVDATGVPMADVLLTLMRGAGAELDSFGEDGADGYELTAR